MKNTNYPLDHFQLDKFQLDEWVNEKDRQRYEEYESHRKDKNYSLIKCFECGERKPRHAFDVIDVFGTQTYGLICNECRNKLSVKLKNARLFEGTAK